MPMVKAGTEPRPLALSTRILPLDHRTVQVDYISVISTKFLMIRYNFLGLISDAFVLIRVEGTAWWSRRMLAPKSKEFWFDQPCTILYLSIDTDTVAILFFKENIK